MKKSSKHCPPFDNVLLKRWLLHVGPVRRKILLVKFKDHLVNLGLRHSAVRKGLLQLSSSPVVCLKRVATTVQRSKKCDDNFHLSLVFKESEQPFDTNNNGKNVGSMNADFHFSFSMNRSSSLAALTMKESHVTKPSAHSSNEPSTSSLDKNKNKNQVIADKFSRKIRSSSPSRRKSGSKTKKRVREENPNGITWRLIPIDSDWRPKPSNDDVLLRQQQMKRKIKINRKFKELFGEDSDVNEYGICPATHSQSKCRQSSSSRTSDSKLGWESPIFVCSRKKLKPHHDHGSDKASVPCQRTCRTSSRSGFDSPTQSKALRDSAQKQILQLQSTSDSSLFPDYRNVSTPALPISCTDTYDRKNSAKFQSIAEKQCKPATPFDNGLYENKSTVGNPPILDTALLAELQTDDGRSDSILDSGLTLDSINSSSQPSATFETTSSQHEKSSAVEHDIKKRQLVEADSVNGTTAMETQNFIETDSTEAVSEVEIMVEKIRKPRKITDHSLSDRTSFCVSNSSDRKFSPYSDCTQITDNLQKEPDSLNDSTCCPLVTQEFDHNPSSTTDIKPNIYELDMSSCATNRLLGALDKIFLTLLCRRRVRERQLGAKKLAIKKNQQEEILMAQHELEAKFITFRMEIRYLFKRLFTKDQVINFIAQGLDHRTPNETKRFTKKEIEIAIMEADTPISLLKTETESSMLPSEPTEPTELTEAISEPRRVIGTIDLTDEGSSQDNDIGMRLCDRSTHPPGSKNNDSKSGGVTNVGSGNDHNGNEICPTLPSIAEVITISTEQFETIREEIVYPCNLCRARTSRVACARCVQAYYCSKNCQELHWVQAHYTKCVPYRGVISDK
ncbi:uncharacterized protein LOC107219271 [Neodiprion lecontei]|uniref:Uncharacterized protein LOC107219271 n=1 Tax=Neodiprion lecontei TaxID=441921 RepID=A0ABM3GAP3_NEOLC|nr:uncharacterized protein LOC107219271 [Neodiprion lecontei]